MTEFLFEGDLLEFPCKSNLPSESSVSPEFRPPPEKTNDALNEFIIGFLLGGGSIVHSACQYYDTSEKYLLWLKNCFIRHNINGRIKKTGNYIGRLEELLFETQEVEALGFYKPLDFSSAKNRQKVTITPLTLFLWYLNSGFYYEANGIKSLRIKGKVMINVLKNLGIPDIAIRGNAFLIKEPSQEKFFSYILSHDYPVPDCCKQRFPAEYLEGHPIFVS